MADESKKKLVPMVAKVQMTPGSSAPWEDAETGEKYQATDIVPAESRVLVDTDLPGIKKLIERGHMTAPGDKSKPKTSKKIPVKK